MVSRVFGSAGALILTLVGVVWYVRLLTQVMDTGSYNTWGAMFLVPVVIALNAVLISQAIRREAEPWFARIIVLAFLAKLVGISARYFVAYFLYGGQADAQAYNLYAINHYLDWRAGEVWWEGSGKLGTLAMELMTTALYVVIGPSVITAFFIFGSMAFWGVYLTYRAFRIALPQGDYRRYAILIFFLPTVLYWPASIGKESWLMLFVGVTALGAARYFNHAVTCRLPA